MIASNSFVFIHKCYRDISSCSPWWEGGCDGQLVKDKKAEVPNGHLVLESADKQEAIFWPRLYPYGIKLCSELLVLLIQRNWTRGFDHLEPVLSHP